MVYLLKNSTHSNSMSLGSPVGIIAVPTNPEDILFIECSDYPYPILVATRRDSTSQHYYSLGGVELAAPLNNSPSKPDLIGTQNLAPHSNCWISFSPSSVSICPTDSSLLAVSTSSIPHMRVMIVRIILPAPEASSANPASSQAEQGRESIARKDRGEMAVLINISTMAPQTPYSTPRICWRPDGSGVWVNGGDGSLRGIEAKTGKIVAMLKGGHEVGTKVRTMWAGLVHSDGRLEEWVISGGFDRRLIVWKPGRDSL